MVARFFLAKHQEELMMPVTLMTEQQAADILAIGVKTLQAWRVRGGGPKYVKVGRCVRYAEHDLEEFILRQTVACTSQGQEPSGDLDARVRSC
jgi:predicted DNA-binding transcriptional regulator AlpA